MGLTILHLTDIHFSIDRTSTVMAAINNEFFADLEHMINKLESPIQLVSFTGDLAFSGSYDEYVPAEQFFKELAKRFLRNGQEVPVLFAVPGNHDCDWTELSSLISLSVERLWDEIVKDFWGPDSSNIRGATEKAILLGGKAPACR